MEKPIMSTNFISCIGTVNKFSQKDNFRTFCLKKRQRERMIEALKQMLLTIYQFNECSFYFEQTRSIECVQNNGFESSIMSSQAVYFLIVL